MKKRYWSFFLIVFAAALFVELDIARRINQKSLLKQNISPNTLQVPLAEAAPILPAKSGLVSLIAHPKPVSVSQIILQVEELSRNYLDPVVLDEKLNKLVHSLTATETQLLADLIDDKHESNDRRALAVELLTRVKSSLSMKILKQFAGKKEQLEFNSTLKPEDEFETVLKAQAIEGIAAYPEKGLAIDYLKSLKEQVSESFLKDRISHLEENINVSNENSSLKNLVE